MGDKTPEIKKQSIILKNFTILEKKFFFEIRLKRWLLLATKQNKMEQKKTKENREHQDLKY